MLKTCSRAATAAFALAFILSCILTARPVRAAGPALTILFTGNTYGNVAPCPS